MVHFFNGRISSVPMELDMRVQSFTLILTGILATSLLLVILARIRNSKAIPTVLSAFLKNMSIDQFSEVLKAKDNTMADFTAPAHGLFLEKVVFPYDLGL